MPTPIPDPTPAQIVTLSDIVMETTDSVTTAIAADTDQEISNAKWGLTLSDITRWNDDLADDGGDIKRVGSIEFFQGASISSRLDFRNAIRRRYGYPELLSEKGSLNEVSSLRWFGCR
jgi:hypothetical protein